MLTSTSDLPILYLLDAYPPAHQLPKEQWTSRDFSSDSLSIFMNVYHFWVKISENMLLTYWSTFCLNLLATIPRYLVQTNPFLAFETSSLATRWISKQGDGGERYMWSTYKQAKPAKVKKTTDYPFVYRIKLQKDGVNQLNILPSPASPVWQIKNH